MSGNSLLRTLFYCTLCVLVTACAPHTKIASIETAFITLTDSTAAEDTAAANLIAPYKTAIDKIMNEVLNVSEVEMEKDQPESLLGNFVADISLEKANEYYHPEDSIKADLCLLNNGGLRATLPKGEITRGRIFELMPFENELVVLTLSGAQTKELFIVLAKFGGMPVSGINMGIADDRPDEVFINDIPFDSSKTYKVVTSDYLANGGGKLQFFNNPLKREDLGIKLRDAIIAYIIEEREKGNKLTSGYDGRIHYVH